MRLFVNVYHPDDDNCVHQSHVSALKGRGYSERVQTIEIEYPGSLSSASEELSHVSAGVLLVRYPLRQSFAVDAVTVGDLNSEARGTGARKSAGKPDWSLIPWWTIYDIVAAWDDRLSLVDMTRDETDILRVIHLMAAWQRGNNPALELAAAMLLEIIRGPAGLSPAFPIRALETTVRVLEFGTKKYTKGNWAKGMQWTVCFNCTVSHLTKAFQGEDNDEESGLPHTAHAMCNMLFLLAYRDLYSEGDDRLPEFGPGGINTADKRHD